MSVVIETTIGDLTVDLLVKERPRTCFNFIKLCKTNFYNCCLFHRIERDFIAQSGDPSVHRMTDRHPFPGGRSIFQVIKGDGHTFFEKENVKPRLKHESFGTLSMVDNGDAMLGSQFFITLGENLDSLDDKHSVFGYVVEGLDIVHKLNAEISDHEHRPFRDIRITHTVILDDPFDDPPEIMHLINQGSPEIWPEVFTSDRIGVEEAVDETEGKPLDVIEEELEEKEAKARATILEMIGDLPDADMAPPENVLFVCKLNPVTRDDDLEVIFSRFGKINSCEIIKDARTGESLQYAFIEFANKEDCEKAYFKMDNVLIDDRRIHVDFSQSVSQYKWRGKGRGVVVKKDEDKPRKDYTTERRSQDYQRHEGNRRDHRRDKHSNSSSRIERSRSRSRDRSRHDKNRDRRSSREKDRKDDRHYHRDTHREKRRSRSRDRSRDRHHRHRSPETSRTSHRRRRSRS